MGMFTRRLPFLIRQSEIVCEKEKSQLVTCLYNSFDSICPLLPFLRRRVHTVHSRDMRRGTMRMYRFFVSFLLSTVFVLAAQAKEFFCPLSAALISSDPSGNETEMDPCLYILRLDEQRRLFCLRSLSDVTDVKQSVQYYSVTGERGDT
jgi:hypothetical protein